MAVICTALSLVLAFAGAALVAAASEQAAPQGSAASRVIPREMNLHEPRGHCAIPAAARAIATATQTPFGIERVSGRCEHPFDVSGERVFVKDRTIGDVLHQLTTIDPRYGWAEVHGVIVVRPVAAWNDPAHYLHARVDSFVHEDVNLGLAHELINSALGPRTSNERILQYRKDSSPDPDDRFDVRLPAMPMKLDILNGIARAHGAMFWEIEYCRPRAARELAMITFMRIAPPVRTANGVRVGGAGFIGNKVWLPGSDGKAVDPCDLE
jgi:hypothetical protein